MKNSKKALEGSQKILNQKDFTKALKEELEKRGISGSVREMPLQPTEESSEKEYTVVFRPFAKRENLKRRENRKSQKKK